MTVSAKIENQFMIESYYDGKKLGKLTPEEFRVAQDLPPQMILDIAIMNYNASKMIQGIPLKLKMVFVEEL